MEGQQPDQDNLQKMIDQQLGNTPSIVPINQKVANQKIYPNTTQLPTLRTYKEDVKEAVRNQNISTARILLQEQKKKAEQVLHEEETTLKSGKNKVFFISSLILIALTGSVLGYYYYNNQKPQEPTSKIIIERPNFIEVEKQNEISITFKNKRDVLNEIKQFIISPIEIGKVNELLLVSTEDNFVNGERTEEKTPITTTNLFELIESRAPNSLIRSLGEEFMLGVYGLDVGEPFVLFKVIDFENAFASMLEWEPLMARDVQPIFFINYDADELNKNPLIGAPVEEELDNSTTSTSTLQEIETKLNEVRFDPTVFRDLVIGNRDTRVIRDEFGEIIFFYTFIDDENLLFATKEGTLNEIIRRLRQARLIR